MRSSVWRRAPRILRTSWLAAMLALAGCAHAVSQDAHTGPDGRPEGATPLQLVEHRATAHGTVTYPGGDRVDWYYLDLPAPGALDVSFEWIPARPGLRVVVDVFDHDGVMIVNAKRYAHRTHEDAHVAAVHGRVYFRIYAVHRDGAARYNLTATFTPEISEALRVDVEYPLPPPLPDLPAQPVWRCDSVQPDQPLDWCRPVDCTPSEAATRDPSLPPCKRERERCPTPPDVAIQACRDTMPCPNPPDPRVASCHKGPRYDCRYPDPSIPNDACHGRTPEPVTGRVVRAETEGADTIITVAGGSDQGVTKNWRGTLLRGDSDQPLAGGELQLIRVDKRVTIARIHATRDVVSANSHVRLQAPP